MSLFNIAGYFHGVREELRKVTWPTAPEVRRHTILVIAVSLFMAVFFWAVDSVLTIVLEAII